MLECVAESSSGINGCQTSCVKASKNTTIKLIHLLGNPTWFIDIETPFADVDRHVCPLEE